MREHGDSYIHLTYRTSGAINDESHWEGLTIEIVCPLKMSVSYITSERLAEIIKSDRRPHKDYLIVDVRDHDFRGGNIKHAVNKPSRQFLHTVDELVKDAKDVPLVVFHCWYSQIRCSHTSRNCTTASRHSLYGYRGPKTATVGR
jgi:hypothetical protein